MDYAGLRKFSVPFQEIDFEGKIENRQWNILARNKEDARNKTIEYFSGNEYVKHIASEKYISDLGIYIPEKDQYKGYYNP